MLTIAIFLSISLLVVLATMPRVLNVPSLGLSTQNVNPSLRFAAKRIKPNKFAAVGAAPLYAVGTPVVFDSSTSTWKVWTNAGANGTGTIRGFVWPDPVQTHATEEVLGNVLLEGTVHRDDVVVPGGETQNNLDAALKTGQAGLPSLRELGIHVDGLVGIN